MGAPITASYTALLAFLFFALSVRAVRLRGALKVAIGDGGQEPLLRAIRVHGNFAEYVPITLLIALQLELAGTSAAIVHSVGACLLLGRAVHAYGVSQPRETLALRVAGMALTFTALVGGAVLLLWLSGTAALR